MEKTVDRPGKRHKAAITALSEMLAEDLEQLWTHFRNLPESAPPRRIPEFSTVQPVFVSQTRSAYIGFSRNNTIEQRRCFA
ncbi:hypothetical protein MFFC18_46740 [Mariniblastus fucicola]|uniref:Uncharacterized protein n=1 Tax=Mariniblastus fucicola TaxID=980251 RepID=A0A5B9PJ96_9BACT|nr:hypothetical protein MFFC18_46740 [Mariniblastus fucicola]